MNQKERAELQNKLYEVIYPVLIPYETRGYNAHQRAQNIIEDTTISMQKWINQQREEKDEARHRP